MYQPRVLIVAAALSLVAASLLVRETPIVHSAVVQQVGYAQILNPGGPLSEIDVSNRGEIEVYDNRICAPEDGCGQSHPPYRNTCGPYVGVAVLYQGVDYGPTKNPTLDCNDEFHSWHTHYTPISQSASGNTVITKASLPGTGAVLTEIVTYSPGTNYLHLIAIMSRPGGKIYVGGESEPESTSQYNYHNPASGAVGDYNPWNGPGAHPVYCGTPSSGTTRYYVGEVPVNKPAHWIIGPGYFPDEYANEHRDYPDGTVTNVCHGVGFGLEYTGSLAWVKLTFGSQAP